MRGDLGVCGGGRAISDSGGFEGRAWRGGYL